MGLISAFEVNFAVKPKAYLYETRVDSCPTKTGEIMPKAMPLDTMRYWVTELRRIKNGAAIKAAPYISKLLISVIRPLFVAQSGKAMATRSVNRPLSALKEQ